MNKRKAYLKYIAALIMFGSNGIVASNISLSSYEIVFTRTLVGSLFLAMIFILLRQKVQVLKNRAHAVNLLISGVAMGASWMFLYEAYNQVGVSVASLAYYCGPVIVMILSPLLFKERMTWTRLTGFAAVMVGMFLVNGRALSEGKNTWGLTCGILSAVMYAFMVISNKKAASIGGMENPMWQLITSFITVAIFLGFKQGFSLHIPGGSVLPIVLLGVFNTGLGCYFYFSSIGNLPVQTVSVLGYLEPLSALFFSALLLGENLNGMQTIGAVVILGGAAFGELFVSLAELPSPA